MKVYRQHKMVVNGLQTSHHTFLNAIATGIKRKLEKTIPNIEVRLGNKSASDDDITLKLICNMKVDSADSKTKIETDRMVVRDAVAKLLSDELNDENGLLSVIDNGNL